MIQYEKKKDQWVKELNYATHYDSFVGAVKDVKEEDGKVCFTLFDKSGVAKARMEKGVYPELSKGIYVFSMGVSLEKGQPLCIIKAARPAVAGVDAFCPMDCFGGLEADKAEHFRHLIESNAGMVLKLEQMAPPEKKTGYGELLRRYMSKEELERLMNRPASVADNRWQMTCGRYVGGALVTAAMVSTLCIDFCKRMKENPNGLYPMEVDYPLLITASVLCMAGMGEYVDDSMNKTQKGVIRGYHSLLQSRVSKLCEKAGVEPYYADRLLNTLQCMFPGSGALKSVTVESSICRSILDLYNECDSCAEYLSGAPTEEESESGFRYSPSLGRFFVFPIEEKEEGGRKGVG